MELNLIPSVQSNVCLLAGKKDPFFYSVATFLYLQVMKLVV